MHSGGGDVDIRSNKRINRSNEKLHSYKIIISKGLGQEGQNVLQQEGKNKGYITYAAFLSAVLTGEKVARFSAT